MEYFRCSPEVWKFDCNASFDILLETFVGSRTFSITEFFRCSPEVYIWKFEYNASFDILAKFTCPNHGGIWRH